MTKNEDDLEIGVSPSDDDGTPSNNNTPVWHVMTSDEVFSELGLVSGHSSSGLTTVEAQARLDKYGLNKLTEAVKRTLLQRIWAQINNILVGVLVVVAVVSVIEALTSTGFEKVFTNWFQVFLIVFVIVLNTFIGIIQEGSAEQAAEALRNLLSSDAVVIRDGEEIQIPASQLVPGDIVKIHLGDRVPADLRIIQSINLACAEATLTGETVPVDKMIGPIKLDGGGDPNTTPLGDRNNMAFSATLVTQGSGVGVVVATGDQTEIGTINKLVNQTEKKKSNVLKQVDTVSKWIAIFVITVAIITFLVARFSGNLSYLDSLTFALVCAVAMIPEGLAAIVTLVYAWAVSNMAKKNAIVRILPAVETLGSVTVICSDKTGTLTKNEMTLTAFVTSNCRYKVNVNSTDRSVTNFVRDDTFLVERAEHHKFETVDQVLRTGPGVSRHKRSNSFQFALSTFFGTSSHPLPPIRTGSNSSLGRSFHTASGQRTGEGSDASNKLVVQCDGDDEVVAQQNDTSPDQMFLRRALAGGVLCSKCVLGRDGSRDGDIGNPTELSLLRALYFADVDVASMKRDAPVITEVPFSSEYKFMATVHEPRRDNDGSFYEDKVVVHVKGAPDRLIPYCMNQVQGGVLGHDEPIDRDYWIEQIAVLSSHGLRVLALCRGSVNKDSVTKGQQLGPEFVTNNGKSWLTMIGLCAIVDPPRPECVSAVAEANGAGIRIVMITGDHKDTALAIGNQLGLVDEEHTTAITGPELDAMEQDELRMTIRKCNVFARASPQNKIQIVKAMQADGEVCSMTGDGVNDAPALKAADMGVAMGKEGTDVAREAAEMILADDNFATIIAAVREGRVVWDNLRKVVLVNQPINNAQGMTVLFGLIFGLPYSPLTAIQVLYCNLICAVTLGFVTAVEPAEDGIMFNPPRKVGKRLIGRYLLYRLAVGTVILVVVSVGATFWVKGEGYSIKEQRSQALNTLTFSAISITLSARFSYNSSWHPRILSGNPYCWYAIAIVTVLQLAITYIPGLNTVVFGQAGMDAKQWGIVILAMVIVFIVMEVEKAVRRLLKEMGQDTDDLEYDAIFDEHIEPNKADTLLPEDSSSHLALSHLQK